MTSSVIYIKKLIRKSSLTSSFSRRDLGEKTRTKARKEQTCKAAQTQIKHMVQDSQRESVVLSRKDGEAYGFEIRTYENTNGSGKNGLTCVCSVKDNSPAESAGLKTGDVIISVNSICIEGFAHQHTVDLIQNGPCLLQLVIERGTTVKQKELQNKLIYLQWQLNEKYDELQMLILQETRLRKGGPTDTLSPSCLASELVTLPSQTVCSITSRAQDLALLHYSHIRMTTGPRWGLEELVAVNWSDLFTSYITNITGFNY